MGWFGDDWAMCEAYDSLDNGMCDDGGGFDTYHREPKIVTCKHCKQSGFTWTSRGGKWFLEDDTSELHLCLTEKYAAKQASQQKKRAVVQALPFDIDEINIQLKLAALEDRKHRYLK